MDVGIVAQKGNSRAAFLSGTLRERLREEGVNVALDAATAAALDTGAESDSDDDSDGDGGGVPVERMAETDLVVSIGGDGTFLFAARGAEGTPIVGVNLGEVGFLNAVGPEEAVDVVLDVVSAFRDGTMDVREAPRLRPRSDGWIGAPAANEVVVQGPRRGHGGGVGVEVRVDGSLYTGGHADGVLVATPTGSTAYNLSEHGPLVHPGVDAVVVNEMCAEGGMPPLVVDDGSTVSVTLTDADSAVVVSDGRAIRELDVPTEVTVEVADTPVRIAGPPSNFFEALGKLD